MVSSSSISGSKYLKGSSNGCPFLRFVLQAVSDCGCTFGCAVDEIVGDVLDVSAASRLTFGASSLARDAFSSTSSTSFASLSTTIEDSSAPLLCSSAGIVDESAAV